MNKLIFIACIFFADVTFAEQYICVADLTSGFAYNSTLDRWESANFRNDQNKYIISSSEKAHEAYKVTKIGEKDPAASCEKGFNEPGFLFCIGSGAQEFRVNKNNGRYLKIYAFGYYNVLPDVNGYTDKESDNPFIEIGKCSPL